MLIHDDLNGDLVRYIDSRAVTPRLAIFYISRRHWLEIVAELVDSLTKILTVIALASVIPAAPGWLWLTLAVYFFVNPFLIELWRWQRDIYFLSQDGYRRSYYSFASMSYIVEDLSFVTSARVQQLMYYRLMGLDIGTMVAKSADGRQLSTPLMPHPLRLQARINEAKNWKPAAPAEQAKWRL